MTQLSDEERRIIFAESEDLEAARAAIAKLSGAALRIFYIDVETLLVRDVDASRAAREATATQSPVPIVATIESTDALIETMVEPTSTTTTSIDPILEPTSSDVMPTKTSVKSTSTSIEPTSMESTSTSPNTTTFEPMQIGLGTSGSSASSTSIEPASTEPAPTSEPITIGLSFAKAKKLAIAAFEGEYLSRVMTAAKGIVTDAAKLAGEDRTNFKRLLQRNNLRPPGTAMALSTKIEHSAKYTERMLELLANNPQGLRTYEIAEHTEQPIGNAHNILKLLLGQKKIARHGKRYDTLWTLAGGTPVPRVETIPQAAMWVVSKARSPVDSHQLRDDVRALLTDKPPTPHAIRRAIKRLLRSGDLESAGANEHGAMYRLAPKRGHSLLN